ncbi:hypothetical protein [Streptomyces sp. SM14]|nr:hypothetical protein [Streptomyces sp. SM14]
MDGQFRLDGFAPHSPQSQELADDLLMSADMHHVLAAHHSQDGRDSTS